ncbi:coiled-coil domain-containing protein 187 isoform X2 [Nelusetta ayraudi]|uniref:coiled-coil domain-containing protein 187 isoform X2 n=1 Tax=Nelusetta ayraudi TaxID=303726 RepID=UPI003F71009C
MAELEIDQSNLPRVQEVCQCFAVLEDGALAHNLQEQEIEHYYTTNIQKNQLVQNDIRIAKRLQDEEEERLAQQSTVLRQTSRQLEEQDLEYARLIQEEILRCAEETKRREQDDEEMAKRIQEEEQQSLRRKSRGHEGHSEGSVSDPALPRHSPISSVRHGEGRYSPTATRGQHPTSNRHSDAPQPMSGSRSGVAAQRSTSSSLNRGHTDSFRDNRGEISQDSEDSDSVFCEQPAVASRRVNHNASPPRRQLSSHNHHERSSRGLPSRRSVTGEPRVEEEEGDFDEDYREHDHRERRRPRNYRQNSDRDSRPGEVRDRRFSRSESVRWRDGGHRGSRDMARTWSCRDNSDKHVRFRDTDGARSLDARRGEHGSVWRMLGQVLQERGVPVRIGSNGASLQIWPQSRDGSEVSCGDSQPHQRGFQRASAARHSFHGDIRERRRPSHRESSGRDRGEGRDRRRFTEFYETGGRESRVDGRERRGGGGREEVGSNGHGVKWTAGERRHWREAVEEGLSSEEEQEEEEVEPQVERRSCRRAPQRSQSLSSSSRSSRALNRRRWPHVAAGAPLQPELGEASLHLGELHQVLQDEELARRLQEEEEDEDESLLRRNSRPSMCSSYPEGDFRAAQVAQDEEIAHFMQKQEIKSKRRSRELEGPSSWREHRAMMSHHDRRVARDQQVQRERLDSEGLPSPTEDCCPENLPPSPTSTMQTQHMRNIAEELDPTFQARRRGPDSGGAGQSGSDSQSLPITPSGMHDPLEEPTFIPPTKRQADKPARSKPKEKKENCKQQ